MAVELVHRPARSTSPARLADPVQLEPPPDLVAGGSAANFMALVPLLGAAVSMTAMMLLRHSPLAAIGALMMIVTVVASIVLYVSQMGKAARQRSTMRDIYLDYLDRRRTELRDDERGIQTLARQCNPSPRALPDLVRDPHRLWERRRHHEDFLQLRLGQGEMACREISKGADTGANTRPDPFMQHEMEQLVTRYSAAPQMPVCVDLLARGQVSVVGDQHFCQQVARLLLLQAASLHSPEDLELAMVVDQPDREAWRWADQLPHLLDQEQAGPLGPQRRLCLDMADLTQLVEPSLRARSLKAAQQIKTTGGAAAVDLARMLVLDTRSHGQGDALQLPDQESSLAGLCVTVVHLVNDRRWEPDSVQLRVTQTPDGFRVEDYRDDPLRPVTSQGVLDEVDEHFATGLVRQLAPLRLSPDSLEHAGEQDAQQFNEMVGVRDFSQAELHRLWRPRAAADFLRVPVGVDDRGRPVRLDLKEAAQLGMGPHGLCVGATGSGKSEFLRALVLSLLLTHGPDRLNMVLVDYKGGATFAPFEGVPHVSGIITNLQDDVSLVDRVHASLAGEVERRQEVLKRAGNISNITDYELHRRERAQRGEELEPLPHLFVVIDEFGELLTARPDFIDLFLSIGRIGRSVGVHLLLSSQRIESGKMRGLETYLSYRVGLRTLSDSESRTVLDTPDAFTLPPLPGWGYLKVDTTVYTRFRSGYVSGPVPRPEQERDDDVAPAVHVLPDFTHAEPDETPDDVVVDPLAGRTTGATVLSTSVELLRAEPRATAPIWLPPLPVALGLDAAGGGVTPTSAGPVLAGGGNLVVPIGLLDDPEHQWQGQWFLDLNRAGGNAVIIGGPATGKSTALRTVALSLAMTHSPSEVALYGLDLRGSALMSLRDLPHSGGMAMRTSREAVRRTVEELVEMLAERERVFEEAGIGSIAELRRRRAAGEFAGLGAADVVLLVDGYGQLFDEFEQIERQVHALLSRGGGYGIHVVATATRWNEVRIAQQPTFGNRIEFRLAEPGESSLGRKLAETIPVDRPGRGMDASRKLIGQVSLPRIDGIDDPDSLNEGLSQAVAALLAAAPEQTARRVRVLPPVLRPDDLELPTAVHGRVPLGLQERDFAVRNLDLFGRDRHLVVLGDDACGKSNTLRWAARQLQAQYSPEEIVFAVVDPRRSLADAVDEAYLGGYAPNSTLAARLAASVSKELASRVPQGAEASTPGTVPSPRIVLLVDDYDVLTAGRTGPLNDFVPYLAMGAELGFHVLMTRKVAGASRGMFDAFHGGVREAGAATLVMDGDRSEGALVGSLRAAHQPQGRGLFVSGGRAPETVQVLLDPATNLEEDR